MHPLFMLGVAAAGTYAIAKAAPATPPPVDPAITKAATAVAQAHMANGATPEQAARRAAHHVANRGGGFWKTKSSDRGVVRF